MANITERVGKSGEISYLIRVFVSENKSGKQKVKSTTWRPPKPDMSNKQIEKALNAEAVRFEDAVRNGTICFDGNTTFEQYAAQFMKHAQLAPMTRDRYGDFLNRINPAIGHIRLSKLQSHHLEELYMNLAEGGVSKVGSFAVTDKLISTMKSKNISVIKLAEDSKLSDATITAARQNKHISIDSAKAIAAALDTSVEKLFTIHTETKGLSDKTIRDHHRLISVILAKAKKERIVPFNVAQEHTNTPKVKAREAKYLNEQEAGLLVSKLIEEDDIRIKSALLLLIYSGIRRGELCGLEWPDIDFEKYMIHIKRARQYQRNKGIVVVPTKNRSSQRSIKLPSWLFDILRSYRSWWNQQKLVNGADWMGQEEAVFIQEDGKPISPDTINYWLTKFNEDNGLKNINPHGLRHTFATLQITAGVDIRTLQARTGHAQASTLINIYSHELRSAEEAASEALDSMLMPKPQTKSV